MSVLTRIKNNQILDSGIWANAKIIPGSITGSLFSSNIVVTSDFVITGNLYVAGASTSLTVASTNTLVNDPLIVLNNAYAAGAIYDIGFIFERGTDVNQAFYWDETSDEFKLIATTEAGSTYGNIGAETSFSNFRLGNIFLNNYAAERALFIGSSGLITTDAEYSYNATNDTLTVGKFLIVGNSAVTIQTTGANQNLKLAPSGTGVVDFNGTNATNLADPLSAQDAVTLAYIQSTSSSAVTNIGDDNSQIIVVDDGTNAGQINANVDATSVLVLKSNSVSIFGDAYTGASPRVLIDAAGSNVAITGSNKLFVGGATTLNGTAIVGSTTDSTSATTGALQVLGGLGVVKNAFFGNSVTIAGELTVQGNIVSLNVATLDVEDKNITVAAGAADSSAADGGGLTVAGASANLKYVHATLAWELNQRTRITSTVPASSSATGALQVVGGAGIGGNLYVGAGIQDTAIGNVTAASGAFTTLSATGVTQVTSTVPASTNQTGALIVTGGVGIGGNLFVGAGIQNTTIGNTTASTGAFTDLRATGTVYANATADSTTLTTGALITFGGAAVTKSVVIGDGLLVNSAQGAKTFQVKGQGNNALIVANASKNAIVFSTTGNTTPSDGAIVKFDSQGAIQVPVGTSAQRPGSAGNVDLVGMLRYNTTSNNLEFCTAAGSPGTYTVAGSEFTVIETNSFNGDGSDTTFTLSESSSTAGTLVMVNGVVQIPTTAYSVTGTTLTFTEAPAVGDVIDARTLITTASVTSIASSSGFNTFDVSSATYANITAGTSAATVRVSVDSTTGKVTFTNDVLINGSLTVLGDSNGNINIGNETGDRLQLRGKTVYDQTAINVPDTNLKELDSFNVASFTTARYTVQVVNGGSVSAAELLISHDDATSNIATYAVLSTIPGTFQSNIASSVVRLFYTPSGAQNANIKLLTTYIV